MKIYNKTDLACYMSNDWILRILEDNELEDEGKIRTNQWLKEMEGKRMIYADMYGDLLEGERKSCRVLDIGGGYNALTKVLARMTQYTLIDFFSHEYASNGGGTLALLKRHEIQFVNTDWYEFPSKGVYDIVKANDIFPDVDQRLELFLDCYLPKCREMRILLTFYNSPRFYTTKRIDDAEIMTFLSWDGAITALKLQKYEHLFMDNRREEIDDCITSNESVFWNGRQCAYLRLRGTLNER